MPELPQPTDGTPIATAPSRGGAARLDHRHRRAGAQRPQLPHPRPGRADPAARRALPEPDGALQPGAGARSATCTPRAPARSASSRPPRTSRRTPRRRCSSRASKTEMLARFSTVAGEQGSPDTWRDPRGFSLKFYTTEGNYDLVGNNTPVFFIRDTMKFPHFIRSPEAPRRLGPARQQHAVGLLEPQPGVGAPGDLPDGRPRHPEDATGT